MNFAAAISKQRAIAMESVTTTLDLAERVLIPSLDAPSIFLGFLLGLIVSAFLHATSPVLQHLLVTSRVRNELWWGQPVVVMSQGRFLILIDIDDENLTGVIPGLSASGELEFLELTVKPYFENITLPNFFNPKLATLKTIAPIVLDRCHLAEELEKLKSSNVETKNLKGVLQGRVVDYDNEIHNEKAYQCQQQAIERIQRLMELQEKWIRDCIIASRLEAFDPNTQINKTLHHLSSQIQDLRQQFEDTLGVITTCSEL